MTAAAPEPRAAAWPPLVFDAPVLRGLEARARQEIADAGSLRRREAGEVIYRAGEAGSSFFVVAEGRVALRAVRRGDEGETELRAAGPGEVFGEEATVGLGRRASAVAVERALVAEVPVHIFRRAAARSGKAELADRLERVLRRGATRDLLRTLALSRDLPDDDVDRLLDAIRHQSFERGQVVYREGDPAADLWLVAEGMVQLQTEDGERLHVRAYLARGDFFGDAEIVDRCPRTASAVASGPSLLLSIPARSVLELAERHPDLLPRLRRVAADDHAAQRALVAGAAKNATQHVFRDLYRLQVARSLLVIDLESCVRCGHCAWACSELYGVARLVRRGDKVVARVEAPATSGAAEAAPQSLMVPNSCQHCENPACMVDCPTGAIGRDPAGEVFIREELCTGCGACAKACPWDNIQMAARPAGAKRPAGGSAGEFAELAVKCDLCRTYDAGPACVQVCPTSSIFRLNPSEEIADVRELLRGGPSPEPERDPLSRSLGRAVAAPRVRSGAALVGGAAIAAAGIGAVGAAMHARGLWAPGRGLGWSAGVAAATGFLLLLAYAVPKRGVRLWMRRGARASAAPEAIATAPAAPSAAPTANKVGSRVRPHAVAHLAIGLLTMGLALAHAPWRAIARPTTGGALSLVFWLSALAGAAAAVAYRLVPPILARIERTAALPEDFAAARRHLLDRLYREVSGKSDLVKRIFEKILLPYAKSPLGALALLASRRRLRDEERALRARIDRVLEGRGAERLAGLSELVRIVVELRALPAQRWLLRSLRVGLPLHVATFGVALVLLVLHAATARAR